VDVDDEGRTLTAGEAGAWLGDLQRRIRRKDEAAVRIEAAVRVNPEAAITQVALGLLRIDEGRTSEAWPALERAVNLAPDDFMAQYVYGVSLLREVAQVDGMMADALALGRSLAALRKATAINPDASDAWAWLAYGEMLDEHDLADAELAITSAIRLSPGRLDYRLRWADISILRGRVDEARRVLTELAAVTSDRNIAERADRRLAVLNERAAQQLRDRAAPPATPSTKPLVYRGVDVRGDGTIRSDGLPHSTDSTPGFKLREPGAFEERAFGLLTLLECGRDQVRFHVKTGDRTVVATAARITDVELTSFTNASDFAVACGTRTPPDTVYMTWRIAEQQRRLGTAVIVGEAVAVEFLPRDFIPRQ
jgi:Flp pilus assembly protein TadD